MKKVIFSVLITAVVTVFLSTIYFQFQAEKREWDGHFTNELRIANKFLGDLLIQKKATKQEVIEFLKDRSASTVIEDNKITDSELLFCFKDNILYSVGMKNLDGDSCK